MSQRNDLDERALLLRTLTAQREHVLGILEGLSDQELRRQVLPTGWSPLAMVHHLALDVERFWFRMVATAELRESDHLEDGWSLPADLTGPDVFGLYRDQIEEANLAIATVSLDAPPAWWPQERWGTWRMQDLRHIILHVITETAVHAGHLDAARELIDGTTWMVLE